MTAHDIKRLALIGAAATLITGVALPASAQVIHPYRGESRAAQQNFYYSLPTTVRLRPGTIRILRPRCDSAYPMDESSPCGTATGGPVGGRGS